MSQKNRVSILIPVMDQKVLILQRAPEKIWGGHWNFPGGSLEEGEEFSRAAVRELFEETGLVAEEEEMDFLGDLIKDQMLISFFATKSFKGKVKINSESSDYAWVDLEEIEDYQFIPLNQDFVLTLKNYLER